MKTNRELRALARSQLHGSWLVAVGVILIYFILLGASNVIPGIGSLVITGPLTFGLMSYFLNKVRGEPAEFENLFDGFKLFFKSFLLCLLEFVFILLWTLLFIVPGIIKSFSYSMAYFILKDNPDIGAAEAITRSRKMMAGHKGKLFGLCLSFIGWILLCCLSFGIGFLWLYPYMTLSVANFYEDLKQNQQNISNQAE
jgi:uncharacterized membrane protein